MPAEHGAWGILLVSLLAAAVVAGNWDLPLLFFTACVLSLFLLRGSVESYRASGARWAIVFTLPHATLAAIGCGTGLTLFLVYGRWQLLLTGLAGSLLYILQRALMTGRLVCSKEKRSLAAELLGVTLLTLTSPSSWIVARGTLDQTAIELWLSCLLFFTGGVLYVKYRVRGILAHRKFSSFGERLQFAWPVLAYHLMLAAFLIAWLTWHLRAGTDPSTSLRATVLCLAFAPAVLRAIAILFQLGRRFAIPRLGWAELAHSVLFTALVILAYRLAA